jgi:hypothetical protein
MNLPLPFVLACRRTGTLLTRSAVIIDLPRQKLFVFEQLPAPDCSRGPADTRAFQMVRTFRCSTSRFGIGQVEGSNQTPLGLHRIARKIGGGWPSGTVFKSREPVGFTWNGRPGASITTRILWLDGLEPGFNRGGNVDSYRRYIYIHGTGDEPSLGRPASCGCIHLAARDLVPLFNNVPAGTLVWIASR